MPVPAGELVSVVSSIAAVAVVDAVEVVAAFVIVAGLVDDLPGGRAFERCVSRAFANRFAAGAVGKIPGIGRAGRDGGECGGEREVGERLHAGWDVLALRSIHGGGE